jgi:hypothetical protein
MILLTALLLQVAGAQPATGDTLLAKMHDHWSGKWSTSRTFVQRTVVPNRPDQTWFESEAAGFLRIDIAPIDSMNSWIARHDSLYIYTRGKVGRARPYANALGILLCDVYIQPVATTAEKLRQAGFDLAIIHPDQWEGRRVWVVGAPAGDSTSAQFWVDQQTMLLTRVLDPSNGKPFIDGRVTERLKGKVPVETAMVFYRGGKELQREYYNDVKLNVKFEPWLFEAGPWQRPGWIATAKLPE